MTTAREMADAMTGDQIESLIAKAIEERDFSGVEALLGLLVLKDPHRAAVVFDTIKLGLDLARCSVGPSTEAPDGPQDVAERFSGVGW